MNSGWTEDLVIKLICYVETPELFRVTVAGRQGVVTQVRPADATTPALFETDAQGEMTPLERYRPVHFIVAELRPLTHWWRGDR